MTPAGPAAARRRPLAAGALAVAGLIVLLANPVPRLEGRFAADSVTTARKGTPFDGTPAVGALFTASGGKVIRHFCTASVVDSPAGDLLATAAHCLVGRSLVPAGRIVFAPGYHGGAFPFGTWPVIAKYVDRRWSRHRDPNDDVAFLVAGRRSGRPVQADTGAEQLTVNARLPATVRVIAYRDSRNWPIRCTAQARAFGARPLRQLVFACGNYTDGTSGGPFLAKISKQTGTGKLVGVIGGYQHGGDRPGISYSARFGSNIAALYRAAAKR